MSIDSLTRPPSKSCWRVPASHRFASPGNMGAYIAVHDAYVCPNASGIDDVNEILQLRISHIDRAYRKITHQIPIACVLI